jgi:hypothetical protein
VPAVKLLILLDALVRNVVITQNMKGSLVFPLTNISAQWLEKLGRIMVASETLNEFLIFWY